MSVRLKRILRLTLELLVVLPLLALVLLMTSPSLSHSIIDWLNESDLGLRIDYQQGSLFNDLRLRSLQWTNESLSIRGEDIIFQWNHNCLIQMKVCVKQLQIGRLEVELFDTNDSDKPLASAVVEEDEELPTFILPINLLLESINVSHLQYTDSDQRYELQQLSAEAEMRGDDLRIHAASADYILQQQIYHLALQGQLAFSHYYPMTFEALIEKTDKGIQTQLRVKGDLQHLTLTGVNANPYPVKFDASVRGVLEDLIFDADIENSDKIIFDLGTQKINLGLTSLHLHGDADNVVVSLDGSKVTLSSPVDADGEPFIHWGEGDTESEVKLKASWQRLPVSHNTLDDDRQEIQVHDFTLNNEVLQLQAEGMVDITSAGMHWHIHSDVKALNLSKIIDQDIDGVTWSSQLNNHIETTGQYDWATEEFTQWMLDITDGQGVLTVGDTSEKNALKPVSVSYKGRAQHVQNAQTSLPPSFNVELQGVEVSIGDNHVNASGAVGNGQALHAEFHFNNLSEIMPSLGGTFDSELNLTGNGDRPSLQGGVQANNLQYQDYTLTQLDLRFNLLDAAFNRSDVQLNAHGILLGEEAFESVSLRVRGKRDKYRLKLQLIYDDVASLDVACDARMDASYNQQARCQKLKITPQSAQIPKLSLQEDLILAWSSMHENIQIEPFCFNVVEQGHVQRASENTHICSLQQIQLSEQAITGLDVVGEHFPMAWLSVNMSEKLSLQGLGQFKLMADWPFETGGLAHDKTARINMVVDSVNTRGVWRSPLEPEQAFTFSTIHSDINLDAKQAELSLYSTSEQFGTLDFKASIDDILHQKKLKGLLKINGVNIQALTLLSEDIEQLTGFVEADIHLNGSLKVPEINGTLRLRDGQLVTPLLKTVVEDIQWEVGFNTRSATIAGSISLSGKTLKTTGNVTWPNGQWQAMLNLQGTQIPIYFDPIEQALLTPDFKLTIDADQMRISGDVLVEEALVELDTLPSSAIDESNDVVFIENGRVVERARGWGVNTDVNVRLGDNVRFKGLGADVELQGHLRYLQNAFEFPRARGEISISDGSYTYWGQRLDIREGSFLFAGPIEDPNIKIEAVRNISAENFVVGIRGHGPLSAPVFEVFSDKPMDNQEAMHYLLTGRGQADDAAEGSDLLSMALLSRGVASAEGRTEKFANKIGLRDFQMGASNDDAGAEVQLSGYVGDNIFVSYGMGLYDKGNTLTLRYQLGPQLFIETASGLESAIDIIYSFQHE